MILKSTGDIKVLHTWTDTAVIDVSFATDADDNKKSALAVNPSAPIPVLFAGAHARMARVHDLLEFAQDAATRDVDDERMERFISALQSMAQEATLLLEYAIDAQFKGVKA